jgi:hypothetical protein
VAMEWEQKAGTARKTRAAASGRAAAPRWSMSAAKAVGCSGTRSAERSGRTSGKRRAREAVQHARGERVVVEVPRRGEERGRGGDGGREGLEVDEEGVRLGWGARLAG